MRVRSNLSHWPSPVPYDAGLGGATDHLYSRGSKKKERTPVDLMNDLLSNTSSSSEGNLLIYEILDPRACNTACIFLKIEYQVD